VRRFIPYEEMDKGDLIDRMFLHWDKVSKTGQEFLDKSTITLLKLSKWVVVLLRNLK
jgi:hypothetical protein